MDDFMLYPKISIVTPSFNDATYLEQTIKSVTGQGYPNLEYIVIDGGSTDKSVEIIKKYEGQVDFWVSEKDNGMYDAIQKGFSRSSGEVMGWINSDDVLHPGSLFILAELFQKFPAISWLQGLPNISDERGRIVHSMFWPEVSKLYFYKKVRNTRRYLQQESTFWRRSLWEKAGGTLSNRYRLAGDFELWLRFFQHEKLFHVKALLGSFRTSSKGQASVENFDEYVRETEEILKSYPLSKQERKKVAQMEIVDVLERRLQIFIRHLRRRFGGYDDSVVHDKIYFDGRTQRFYMDREN